MLIEDFGGLVNVKRFGAGFAANGFAVKGQATTFQIYAVIEPLRPREMMILPEGERTRKRVRVYTETKLQTADEAAQSMGDRVTYAGRDYEVQQCEVWNDGEDTFFKAIAVLVEQDTRRVDMEKINVRTFQVVVGKEASTKILDVNANRNYLRIENKDGELAAVVKVGADFLTPANEAQKIAFSAVPTAGTWQIIANGVPTDITAELAFNANYSAVQAALCTQPNCSGCVVTGDYSTGFAVAWSGDQKDTPQALLQIVNNGLLTSANEVYEVQHVTFNAAADATEGVFKLSLNGLETAELAFTASSSDVQNAVDAAGWPTVVVTGDMNVLIFTFGDYAAQSLIQITKNTLATSDGEQDSIQTIYSAGQVSEGTFQLLFDGYTTAVIDVTTRGLANAIRAALEALPNVGSGNVSVSGSDLVSGMAVDFTGLVGPQPLMTIWNNTVTYNNELDVKLEVQSTQDGIGPAPYAGTVARTAIGHGNDAITAAVTETTAGVADNHEGFPLPAGAVPGNPLKFDVGVPIQAVYALGEDDGVVLEVSEG